MPCHGKTGLYKISFFANMLHVQLTSNMFLSKWLSVAEDFISMK